MAMRKIGEATTDSNGIASFDYTGVGAGLLNIIAKLKDSTLQTEIFALEDCIYYDSATSDTSSRYYLDTSKNNSIAFSDGSLVFTCGSQYRYVQLGGNNGVSNVSDYTGKNVIFKADVQTSSKVKINIIEYVDGYVVITTDNTEIQEDGTITGKASISSNATRVLFRVDAINSTQGDVIRINNLRIYPI